LFNCASSRRAQQLRAAAGEALALLHECGTGVPGMSGLFRHFAAAADECVDVRACGCGGDLEEEDEEEEEDDGYGQQEVGFLDGGEDGNGEANFDGGSDCVVGGVAFGSEGSSANMGAPVFSEDGTDATPKEASDDADGGVGAAGRVQSAGAVHRAILSRVRELARTAPTPSPPPGARTAAKQSGSAAALSSSAVSGGGSSGNLRRSKRDKAATRATFRAVLNAFESPGRRVRAELMSWWLALPVLL
jgi:hypothetical protein